MGILTRLRSISLILLSIPASASPPKSGPGWHSDNEGIHFIGSNDKVAKTFPFVEKSTPTVVDKNGVAVGGELLRVVGGATVDGKYAWLDQRFATWTKAEYQFRYFGPKGELLWEKNNVYGGVISADGKYLILVEPELRWISTNEHGNSPHPANLYDASGKRKEAISDCLNYLDSVRTITTSRYAVIPCRPVHSIGGDANNLAIDLSTGRTKKLSAMTGVEIHDDGTYILFESKQSFNPETKKYGEFVRKEIGAGRFE